MHIEQGLFASASTAITKFAVPSTLPPVSVMISSALCSPAVAVISSEITHVAAPFEMVAAVWKATPSARVPSIRPVTPLLVNSSDPL